MTIVGSRAYELRCLFVNDILNEMRTNKNYRPIMRLELRLQIMGFWETSYICGGQLRIGNDV
jgi:hypothetical protein